MIEFALQNNKKTWSLAKGCVIIDGWDYGGSAAEDGSF